MDKELITALASEAKRLVADVDEDMRTAAFQAVLTWLMNAQAAGPSAAQQIPQPGAERPPSLNEFLAALPVNTHIDRITAILYHSLRYADNDRMTNQEILDAYGRVRERRPTNVSDLVSKSIRKGHIVEASEGKDGRTAWQITPTGERYVEGLRA
jgi:hypothetical protein